MIKRFFKDSVIYGLSGLITRGISIFLVPLYTRALLPSDYGIIDIISITSIIILIIFPLEITQAIARYYPSLKSQEQKTLYSSSSLWFTIAGLSVFLTIFIIFSDPLSKLLFERVDLKSTFIMASISIFFNGLMYFFQNQLRWRLEPKKVAFLSVFYSLLTIALTVLFVLIFKYGVSGVFTAQVLSGFVSTIMAYFMCKGDFKLVIDFKYLKELLNFSAPLVFASLGVFGLRYVDRIFIKGFLNMSDLGVYGIGYRFASISNLALQGFATSITPLIYKNYEDENTPQKLADIFRFYFIICILITTGLSIYAPEYIRILTTPNYYSAASLIPILTLSFIILSLSLFMPGIYIKKKTKLIAVINIISAAINVFFNFLLIPKFGVNGTAIAMLISAVIQTVLIYYYSQKEYFIPYTLNKYLFLIILVIPLIILGYNCILQELILSLFFKTLLIFFIISILFITRFIKIEEIKKIKLLFKREA